MRPATPPADLAAQLALKARLPRSWPAFFARHGRFTPAQLAAIPPLLDGADLLLCAPTASGKTAAVLAPLIERHLPPDRPPVPLAMLYLVPTRALANDLRTRLAHPLSSLGLRLAVKTHENPFAAGASADLLITTPEGADALLATQAGRFAGLRALVIDELHLFDGTPRGDQLRVLLRRLRQIRAYAASSGDAPDATTQLVALSATLADPAGAAVRYMERAEIVELGGARPLEAELINLQGGGTETLLAHLASFRARGWRKALAFCNSRAEVERYAAAARPGSPFGEAVFVHYSNIEGRRRREIEAQYAAADSAICFASSTLELGIDIGSVDSVILIGPPGSPASFAQRVGRGNRRGSAARATCCYRTPLERLLFTALLAETRRHGDTETRRHGDSPGMPSGAPGLPVSVSPALPLSRSPALPLSVSPSLRVSRSPGLPVSVSPGLPVSRSPGSPFRPSVAVQQCFSLIQQSPTAALRLAPLAELFAGLLERTELEQILGQLVDARYLQPGRPGEWRAGPRLNQLFDAQRAEHVSLSIYSNIEGSSAPTVAIRDQHTQQVIANVDALWLDREALTLEGRPISVEWSDGEALWVSTQPGGVGGPPIYRAARQLLSLELALLLPAQLGLPPNSMALVQLPGGCLCFHWLGDLYGRALQAMLAPILGAADTAAPGLALLLPEAPRALPPLGEGELLRYLHGAYRQYEPLLELGPFQPMLPTPLRRQAVIAQFGVARFLAAYAALTPVAAPPALVSSLEQLLE